jgi:hypothetical protein
MESFPPPVAMAAVLPSPAPPLAKDHTTDCAPSPRASSPPWPPTTSAWRTPVPAADKSARTCWNTANT